MLARGILIAAFVNKQKHLVSVRDSHGQIWQTVAIEVTKGGVARSLS